MTKAIIEKKRSEIQQSFEYWSRKLDKPQDFESIINSSATEIVHGITILRKWTCEQVMLAFCFQTLQLHKRLNCCTAFMFERALNLAKQLDLDFAESGWIKPKGILHGVPISVKDIIHVKGFDSTSGYTRYCFKPNDSNNMLVDVLESAGAIVFCKTNIPQVLLTFECYNPMFGRTLNPFNTSLTPGGSSGGEAALISGKGSCLGIGSDIGGSLRIPAHFCGIYTLKPSFGRITRKYETSGMFGFESVKTVVGPMSRSIEDLELFMKVAVESKPWLFDSDCIPIEWNTANVENNIVFGYYESDGFFAPVPACQRAVRECVEALTKQGYKCVEFKPPRISEFVNCFFQFIASDGCKSLVELLGKDEREPNVASYIKIFSLPKWIKSFVGTIMNWFGQRKAASLLGNMNGISVYELLKVQHRRQQLCQEFLNEWNKAGIDALIAPVNAFPAIKHETFRDLSFAAAYTFLYNILDYTVGVIPVTNVDKQLDRDFPEWNKNQQKGNDLLESIAYRHYDPDLMHGMPVGVQIVGGRLAEEKTLALMKIVDKALLSSKNN